MGKISILIASKDGMYNEALAAAFLDINKKIRVTAVPFDSIGYESIAEMENYDAILIEEVPEDAEKLSDRMMIFTDKRTIQTEGADGRVYKYQNAESIFEQLYETKIKTMGQVGRFNDSQQQKEHGAGAKALSVGVICAEEEEACCSIGLMLGKALAYSGKRALYFDFGEFQNDVGIYINKEGKRSWDDLIYCCVYGKSDDVLAHPQLYAAEEESGLLILKSSEGRNPYWDMDSVEKEKLLKTVREKLQAEVYLSLFKDDAFIHTERYWEYYDILILVHSGSGRGADACDALKKALTEEGVFKGEVLDVCSGSSWKDTGGRDFSVFFPVETEKLNMEKLVETQTFKDILRISRYIEKNVMKG